MAAGDMSQAELVTTLRNSLQDAAKAFVASGDEDFKRHLDAAALDFGRKRKRTMVGTLTLVADQAAYALPADYVGFKHSVWGQDGLQPKPWEACYAGPLPDFRVAEEGGVRKAQLVPAPTAAQIAALGSTYRYFYFAGHLVSPTAANTTIFPGERGLLILRAQAEAMREVMLRNSTKAVQLRDGFSGVPRNGMPSHIYQQLMDEFEAASC